MIALTGSTGHLGRLVIDRLLESVPADGVVAIARTPEDASDLADRGADVREADYAEPDSLEAAFTGVDRLLFISNTDLGQRVEQHRNVIEAAKEAGVGFIAYTSIIRADTNPMQLAAGHRATEAMIRDSGLPFAFLRNGWYTENYTAPLQQTLEHGVILGSAGEGRVSAATRADYAAAAAAVLLGEGHEGAVYELGGDEAFTMEELAAEITRQSGTGVVYRDLPEEEYAQALVGFGLPEPAAAVYADADARLREGHLYVESGDLRRLIGRPTTPLRDAVAEALAAVS